MTTVFVTHDQEEAMEVADEIVVINDGKVEQVGTPDDLYDRPANDFVMHFLGPVTVLGDRMVRPYDIDVLLDSAPSTVTARVEAPRATRLRGAVDAVDADGQTLSVQLTRAQAQELALAPGREINLRPAVPAAGGAANGERTVTA